jgi:DNA-binding MarR family transcriptional regulator
MVSNENAYLKTQIAIVKTLLDGSRKTQNQIAAETNYEKSTISHAIDDLEKRNINIIKREEIKKESGNRNKGKFKNKLCWLTYEIDNGLKILEFFRDALNLKTLKQQEAEEIIETLQKNDKFLGILLEKHPLFYKLYFNSQKVVEIFEGQGIDVDELIQTEKDDFKKKLKSSPTFFKICFLNETENIINIFTHMYWFFITEYVCDKSGTKEGIDIKNVMDGQDRAPLLRLRNIGYKVCTFVDVLNGLPDSQLL